MHFRLRAFLAILFAAIGLGTIGFAAFDNLPLPDAFYLTMVTIATVGYGDVHPVTNAGKAVAIVVTIMGVATFLGVITNATDLLLNRRAESVRRQRLNMVIGIFFSEVGTKLLSSISGFSSNLGEIRKEFIIDTDWNERDFLLAREKIKNIEHGVDIQKGDLEELKSLLLEKRSLMVSLMQNPTLMEQENFTELLRAVFHLIEELAYRNDVMESPDSDKNHLTGDIERMQNLLIDQWLDYIKHLRDDYPYLFSLAIRTNPFNEEASPIIK
jgi:voltage-gated potassium channel